MFFFFLAKLCDRLKIIKSLNFQEILFYLFSFFPTNFTPEIQNNALWEIFFFAACRRFITEWEFKVASVFPKSSYHSTWVLHSKIIFCSIFVAMLKESCYYGIHLSSYLRSSFNDCDFSSICWTSFPYLHVDCLKYQRMTCILRCRVVQAVFWYIVREIQYIVNNLFQPNIWNDKLWLYLSHVCLH